MNHETLMKAGAIYKKNMTEFWLRSWVNSACDGYAEAHMPPQWTYTMYAFQSGTGEK